MATAQRKRAALPLPEDAWGGVIENARAMQRRLAAAQADPCAVCGACSIDFQRQHCSRPDCQNLRTHLP